MTLIPYLNLVYTEPVFAVNCWDNIEKIDQKPFQRSEQKNISLSQSVHSEVWSWQYESVLLSQSFVSTLITTNMKRW